MDEDAEAQRGTRRQKLLHLTRDDLAQIPVGQVRELLTKYDPLIRGFVRRFPSSLLGPQFDAEDLYSLGRTMLLQMWILYDPEVSGNGSFQGWATFLFRQAFSKISRDLQRNPEIVTDVFITSSPVSDEDSGGRLQRKHGIGSLITGNISVWWLENAAETPELDEALDAHGELARLDRALEALKPRYRFILQGVREGRTTEQIAGDLGVSRQRVDQLREVAMRALRLELGVIEEPEEDEPDDEPNPRQQRATATVSPIRPRAATLLAS